MGTLRVSRARKPREGALAHLLRLAREGDSAATPLVLLVGIAAFLTLVVTLVLALALLVERLA